MIIKNASVFTENNCFEGMNIYIEGERFAPMRERERAEGETEGAKEKRNAEAKKVVDEEQVIDAEGCYAIPGLTDIHFHGCDGSDFCDGTIEAIDVIAAYEASVGVTTIVPATMTLARTELLQICEKAAEYKEMQQRGEKPGRAILCGINLEGPFISKEKKGAQNQEFILPPDQELFEELQTKSKGLIKLVDLAPETDGAREFIAGNKDAVKLSLAHSNGDYDTAMQAFEAGADHVTHLYNGMSSYSHRAPGLEVELICDDVHVHPAVVRNTLKLFGEDKVIFISDSMRATGLTDGNYTLGGQMVKVKGNLALLTDGTIAGSVSSLMDCMRRAVLAMKVPLETAVRCAAVNPARSVGIFDEYGSIRPGKIANLVLLKKEDLSIERVIIRGQELKN